MHLTFASTMGKKLSFVIIAALACLFSTAAVMYANANFSGEWTLNQQKSELGDFGARIAAKKLKIDAQAQSMAVERAATNMNGEDITMKETLTFDGKEAESTVFGNAKKKSVAKWSDDGQVLTVNSTILLDRNGEQMEIKTTEVYKLVDNGNALSIESTSTSSWGTNTMKLMYDKAK